MSEYRFSYEFDKIIQLLELKFSEDEIKELVRENNTQAAITVARSGENWKDYLQIIGFGNLASSRDFETIATLKFLGVPIEFMATFAETKYRAKQIPQDKLDIIFNTAIDEGKLDEDMRAFVKKYNINYPTRYPLEILKGMKDNYSSQSRQSKLNAVMFITKSDYNSAFDHSKKIYASLHAHYNTYIYEVGSDEDFQEFLVEHGKKLKGMDKGKIDLFVISGHGNKTSVNFANLTNTDVADLDLSDISALTQISKYADSSAQLIFESCSAYSGGESDNNMKTWVTDSNDEIQVFAAEGPTSIGGAILYKNGRVDKVRYRLAR